MNRATVLALGFAFLVLISVSEAQQRQRGQLGGQTNNVQLLSSDAVQKDLALSDEQAGKLREVLAAYQKDAAEVPQLSRQDLQNLPEEQRRQKLQENRQALTKVQEQYDKQLAEILKPEQSERLGQIRLQIAGPEGVTTPEVAEKLGLNREDRQKVQTALREITQAARQGGRPTPEQRANLREQLETKLKELLSEEQLAKLKELQGKPFDVSQLQQPRRRTNNN
jgi:hypothetical protein